MSIFQCPGGDSRGRLYAKIVRVDNLLFIAGRRKNLVQGVVTLSELVTVQRTSS